VGTIDDGTGGRPALVRTDGLLARARRLASWVRPRWLRSSHSRIAAGRGCARPSKWSPSFSVHAAFREAVPLLGDWRM